MKNVIFLTIDAFCYKNLELKIGNEFVTPFLNYLAHKSIHFTNMYSQAPYTEAALVSILSGERTLENGGYFLANANVKSTIFEYYRKFNFKTLLTYSPYVYSKSYLRGVDEYYYTRLYSIKPLFDYRLYWFREKMKLGLTEIEYKICYILLKEALETWLQQSKLLLLNTQEVYLIKKSINSLEVVKDVMARLRNEILELEKNKKFYIDKVLYEYDKHILLELDSNYNKKKLLAYKEIIKELYNIKLNNYQKKYNSIVRSKNLDWKYICNCVKTEGIINALKLIRRYYMYYNNTYLKNYINNINENSKVEASLFSVFNKVIENIIENDKKNLNYFAYIHVQDFHLPTVFHTVDTNNINLIKTEFEEAFRLLEKMDNNFNGNIIATLGARFCDSKIKIIFDTLKNKLNNDFIFVITADHGYPAYDAPVRAQMYNQTYTEAFQIPMIIYDSANEKEILISDLTNNIDGIELIKKISIDKRTFNFPKHKYILTEYGGPGCPVINEKPIWYTLIDNNYCISAESMLEEDFTINNIVKIYDLKKDPEEKNNIIHEINKIKCIENYIAAFQKRHKELQKFNVEFYDRLLSTLKG